MCTFYRPFCVLYIVHLFHIGITSVSFWNSVICIFFVQLFSNRLLPIIFVVVHYSDTRNVFQIFRSSNWKYIPVVRYYHHLGKSINSIVNYRICAWFRLRIGFSKAYCHYSHRPGYMEPVSPTGVEVSETIVILLESFSKILWTTKKACSLHGDHNENFIRNIVQQVTKEIST